MRSYITGCLLTKGENHRVRGRDPEKPEWQDLEEGFERFAAKGRAGEEECEAVKKETPRVSDREERVWMSICNDLGDAWLACIVPDVWCMRDCLGCYFSYLTCIDESSAIPISRQACCS